MHDEIIKYIDAIGIAFPDWYVGIASDPHKRLFSGHNVEKGSYWGSVRMPVQWKSPASLRTS